MSLCGGELVTLWDIWVKIRASFDTYITSGGPATGADSTGMFREAYGMPYHNELERIEDDFKAEMKRLRDLAKY